MWGLRLVDYEDARPLLEDGWEPIGAAGNTGDGLPWIAFRKQVAAGGQEAGQEDRGEPSFPPLHIVSAFLSGDYDALTVREFRRQFAPDRRTP